MTLEDLMGLIVDKLYAGLTGGTAALPLPTNMHLNFISPGIPFDPSAFDWAIAGPFAGPTPLTLDDFRELVKVFEGDFAGAPDARAKAIAAAKTAYQQQLLSGWEQWSQLVDFIPVMRPAQADTQPKIQPGKGRDGQVSIVYAQAGFRLSDVYGNTLSKCRIAKDELTEQQLKTIERLRSLLQEEVEVEDFLTGDKTKELRESRVMTAYKAKRIVYENAVIAYAQGLARANSGTAAELVEWSQSGGVIKQRAVAALQDWIALGYKNDVERAQATINQILGTSMAVWVDRLRQDVEAARINTLGAFGYPFFPAALIPGTFARSSGWSKFSERELHSKLATSSVSRDWGAAGGMSLGLFTIAGGASGHHENQQFDFKERSFGIEFEYTQVEILRPAFNPNFFLSRGWKPTDDFVRLYNESLHSDGEASPKGAMIGYPTKALFVRDLKIYSRDFARFMSTRVDEVKAGATIAFGPFCVGGTYAQKNRLGESNLDVSDDSITVNGLQLVGFLSALFPKTANPSPDIKEWD